MRTLSPLAAAAFLLAAAPTFAETTGTMTSNTPPTKAADAGTTTGAASFTTPGGTQVTDIKVGDGKEVTKGSTAVVHYTGTLLDGRKFDSSKDRNRPFPVSNVGNAGVIRGWNEGLIGLRKGGIRRLVIPASSGYGPDGMPPVIPPNATLVFEIECVDVR
jgi:FKBP-type peptidyl-prolyl cis-trans isomerase